MNKSRIKIRMAYMSGYPHMTGIPSGEFAKELKKTRKYFRWIDAKKQIIIYPHPKGDYTYNPENTNLTIPSKCGYEPGYYDVIKLGKLWLISKYGEIYPPLELSKNLKTNTAINPKFNRILKELIKKERQLICFDFIHYDGYLYILFWEHGDRKLKRRHGVMLCADRYVEKYNPELFYLYDYPFLRVGLLREKYRRQMFGYDFFIISQSVKKYKKGVISIQKHSTRPWFYLLKNEHSLFSKFVKYGVIDMSNLRVPMLYGRYEAVPVVSFNKGNVNIDWMLVRLEGEK